MIRSLTHQNELDDTSRTVMILNLGSGYNLSKNLRKDKNN